jgi:hypothetical protein
MVVDGTQFASDIFITEAQEDMATVSRDCATELIREISQKSMEHLDIQDGLAKML